MAERLDSIICLRPFYSLNLNIRGDVSVCCPAWSRGMIGNTRKKSLQEIWNGKPLRVMRQLMLEGRWDRICRTSCPVIMQYRMTNEKVTLSGSAGHVITEDILSAVRNRQTILSTGPTEINLSNSTACNLDCIMCGREHHKDDKNLLIKETHQVTELLPGLRELFLTGNGDPFARPDTRELLLNLDSTLYPNLRINLLTNGLLLPKYWDRIRDLNFGYLNISCDAATQQTYETIRRGGNWKDLLLTFEIVAKAKERFNPIVINMTVMKENYREIPAFVELAGQYGFTADINAIRGKWGDQNFFTSADGILREELRQVILEARERAAALSVPFNSSSFNELLAGHELSASQRRRQQAIDLARALYYKVKPR